MRIPSLISPLAARLAALVLLSSTPAIRGWGQSAPPTRELLTCPESIQVDETAAPLKGWKSSSSTVERKFERVSIYNGKEGEKEFELAPDDQKEEKSTVVQTWRLKGYRTMNIFMRCRYRGTAAVVSADVSPAIETCTFTFEADKKGRITGKAKASCR